MATFGVCQGPFVTVPSLYPPNDVTKSKQALSTETKARSVQIMHSRLAIRSGLFFPALADGKQGSFVPDCANSRDIPGYPKTTGIIEVLLRKVTVCGKVTSPASNDKCSPVTASEDSDSLKMKLPATSTLFQEVSNSLSSRHEHLAPLRNSRQKLTTRFRPTSVEV